MVLGFVVVFFVFRENSFTSSIIEVSEEQEIISTGPYGVVRHPMYVGEMCIRDSSMATYGYWRTTFRSQPSDLQLIEGWDFAIEVEDGLSANRD